MEAALSRLADLDLTEEQQNFGRAVRDFCERELGPERVREVTDGFEDLHDERVARRMAKLGWYGVAIDKRDGGSGGGLLEAGSDVGALSTRAERSDGEWVLNGAKTWCSYAHKAREILIVCRSDRGGSKHEGLSMILVPRDAVGLTLTPIGTLGGRETNEIHLEGCRVPADALLGEEGGGWSQLMAGLNTERVILAASALGLAQRAFDEALAYAGERRQFGRPIASFQATQHKLADLASELVQARLLVRSVARMADAAPNRMLPQEASIAKLACTELAKRCALEGMQNMGGYGYATEYPMEGHLRSAVVTTIYGGTSEIQRNIIAKTLGL